MEKLFDIQNTLLKQFAKRPFYSRRLFDGFMFDNAICGLVGPRGVGKTTYWLHHAMQHDALKQQALYVSADNVYFLQTSLLDLVDQLFKETNVRLRLIDEIHKYQGWQQQLKNIRDTYLDFKIIFSGSSQIDLIHGQYDLSRRVTLYPIHGFSFREYMEINVQQRIPFVSFDELIHDHVSIANAIDNVDIIKHFNDYCCCGYYPFYSEFRLEKEKFQAIENITQKIIYEDISTFHTLKTPTKAHPENTNLMHAAYLPIADDNMMGKVRETFLINHCQNSDTPLFYSQKAGFTINGFTLEVGGRNKSQQQIKNIDHAYLVKDGIFTGIGNTIPLYLFGLLY